MSTLFPATSPVESLYHLSDLFWGCSDLPGCALRGHRDCPVTSGLYHHQLIQANSNFTGLANIATRGHPVRLHSLSRVNPLWLLQNLCGNFIYCLGVFEAENLELE